MLHDLATWWSTFAHFLATYFALEDDVLIPWAYRTRLPNSPYASLASKLAKFRSEVRMLAEDISAALAAFSAAPSGEVLPVLIRHLTALIPALSGYMAVQEAHVLEIVGEGRGSKARLERLVFEYVLKGGCGLVDFVLMTRAGGKEVEARAAKYARGVPKKRLKVVRNEVQKTHFGLAEAAERRFRDEPRWGERKGKARVSKDFGWLAVQADLRRDFR